MQVVQEQRYSLALALAVSLKDRDNTASPLLHSAFHARPSAS